MGSIKRRFRLLMLCLHIILNTMNMEESGTEIEQGSTKIEQEITELEEESVEIKQAETEFCSVSDFMDLNYCLFCEALYIVGPSDDDHEYSIISSETETIEEGKQLYQQFKKPFLLESSAEDAEISYVSPDCKWVITWKYVSDEYTDYTIRWTLFKGEKKIAEVEDENLTEPFTLVKDGDAYVVMEEQTYEKLEELDDRLYFEGYSSTPVLNEQGNLLATVGRTVDKPIGIWSVEDGTNIWSFSNQSMEEDISLTRTVQQFWGDEKEGKLIMRVGDRSFYEISYPSGDMRYIGQDMYVLCYSPDRKYVAYSNCDHDDYYDFSKEVFEEVEAMPQGIYILEVETGRTAFIAQDSELNYDQRRFQWIEKEGFEKAMEK